MNATECKLETALSARVGKGFIQKLEEACLSVGRSQVFLSRGLLWVL